MYNASLRSAGLHLLMILRYLSVTLLLFSHIVWSQKTVTEYFLSMPEHLLASYAKKNTLNKLSNFTDKDKFIKSLIRIEDNKNGYLKLNNKTMTGGGYMEIKILKHSDGYDLILVADRTCQNDLCNGDIQFLTCKNDKWVNVTLDYNYRFNRYYDKTEMVSCEFKLPRWNQKIEQIAYLQDGTNKTYEYVWKENRFVKPLF